ncbi:MAG: CPBP family intramembrane metalloprotease, partial [Planctomycetales bacterium]|nr:CPBP family intramembrane metalloprotease [Planctomycetales bacterium]
LFAASSLTTFGLGYAFIAWRHGSTAAEQGVTRPFGRDVLLGLVAAPVLLLPVFLMQMVLQKVVGESEHPIILLLTEHPDPLFFVTAGILAVGVAPLAEEFFFRVWLQGWLENLTRAWLLRRSTGAMPAGMSEFLIAGRGDGRLRDESPLLVSTSDSVDELPAPELTQRVPERASQSTPDEPQRANPWFASMAEPASEQMSYPLNPGAVEPLGVFVKWIPISLSSLFFALAHWGNGPDPLPLFFLALGLGYLYHQTHRALPGIVVHAICNGISLLILWLTVYNPGS